MMFGFFCKFIFADKEDAGEAPSTGKKGTLDASP
jgi:hypothetical protein